ncbi:MAG: signal recognition particle-docking protein FtsY [Staphylothermus sp.]|nr:signal recognition particle-docking protein FtsY [Staphylothermus sp.]
MFKKIRQVFSKFIEKASSAIYSRDKLLEALDELKLELISNDVAFEVVEDISEKILEAIDKKEIRNKDELVHFLRKILRSYFEDLEQIDIFSEAKKHKPYKIVFLGVNGVGKTTTIAKIAVKYRELGFKPLMVAADTFRAGAQEQLKYHGEKIGIPVFTGKYGSDPAAVAYDAILYAEKKGYDVVLIDTAGRMHTDANLVDELRKIVRVVKPHRKILVVDALTGNDAVEQAIFFNNAVGVDAIIVTKVDAYEQGGVPLSVVYSIKKPVIMMGVGQGYKDLKPFNIDEFLDKILSV